MHRTIALALLLGALACIEVTAPLPANAERFEPPAVYALWWDEVVSCAREGGELHEVEFFVVPGADHIRRDGRDLAGFYDAVAGRIVLADAYRLDPLLVRHEMLHAAIDRSGHPREHFRHRCGDVVSCGEDCLDEAGEPSKHPDVVRIQPSELEVTIAAAPGTPSSSLYDGNFVVVITARNPHPFPVMVLLPPSGDAGPPLAFSYWLDGPLGGVFHNGRIYDSEAAFFRAGETKRAVRDFHIGPVINGRDIPAGSYMARGGFSSKQGPQTPIMVSP